MVNIPKLLLNAGLQLLRPNEQMIDWRQVALNAANVSDATFWSEEEKHGLSSMYAEFIDESTPKIAEITKLQSGPIKNIKVFDRYDWIETNVKAFSEQFAPLEKIASEQTEGSLIGRGLNKSSQVISTLGLGLLLGYLAKRVLGQYDPSLFGREIVSGQVYFVEPNIEIVERQLSLAPFEFRKWIAIHEATHAVVFESVSWLKGYLNQLVKDYFETTGKRFESGEVMSSVETVARSLIEGQQFSILGIALSREQLVLINRLQAIMSVVEGYSDYVMNEIGKDMLSTYNYMKHEFETRRRRKSGREKLFEEVTGLSIKMEQYRIGEWFVRQVSEGRGIEYLNRVWRSPTDVPNLYEVSHPEKWIARQEGKVE